MKTIFECGYAARVALDHQAYLKLERGEWPEFWRGWHQADRSVKRNARTMDRMVSRCLGVVNADFGPI